MIERALNHQKMVLRITIQDIGGKRFGHNLSEKIDGIRFDDAIQNIDKRPRLGLDVLNNSRRFSM